jgi:hypothetical protein
MTSLIFQQDHPFHKTRSAFSHASQLLPTNKAGQYMRSAQYSPTLGDNRNTRYNPIHGDSRNTKYNPHMLNEGYSQTRAWFKPSNRHARTTNRAIFHTTIILRTV